MNRGFLLGAGITCSLLAIALALTVSGQAESATTISLDPGAADSSLFSDSSDSEQQTPLAQPSGKASSPRPSARRTDLAPSTTQPTDLASSEPSSTSLSRPSRPESTTSAPTAVSEAAASSSSTVATSGATSTTTAPITTTATASTAATTTTTVPTTTTTVSPTTTATTTTTTVAATTTTAEAWTQIVLASPGGSIVVSYRPGQVRLDTVSPAPTFVLEDVDEAQNRVEVELQGDEVTYTIEAKWVNGELVTDIDASGPGAD